MGYIQKIVYILLTLSILLTIIIRGYFALHNPERKAFEEYVGKPFTIQGEISTKPLIKDFIQTFNIKTSDGNFLRVGAERFGDYKYGDKVKVAGNLSAPRNFSSDNGRTFDYINYLAKDEIYYEFKKADIEVFEREEKSLSGFLFGLKQKFLDNLGKILGEPHAALAGGLVVGEKSALGSKLLEDFRRAGLIHIVVLSGYNITIIAATIRKILSFLPRNTSIILGSLSIILFGILVGGGATVVRSCIMALIALLGELLRKDYSVMRALFFAGIIMIAQNPLILLYDPSFQLSFLATLGLIILSSPIESRLKFITEKFGIRSIVASTLATQVFVSPLILHMMGELSLVGTMVNIIILPFVPLTMLMVSLGGILGFVSTHISQFFGWIAHILLAYELIVVDFASSLDFATIKLPPFSARIVWGIYILYLALFIYFRSPKQNYSQSLSN